MLFAHLYTAILVASSCLTLAQSVDYKKLVSKNGDRLPDFSFCGYHASDKGLPSTDSEAKTTLSPSSGDQTKRIQDALNKISGSGGGVLYLKEGKYELETTLRIPDGTILRGSGVNRTVLLPQSGQKNVITFGTRGQTPKVSPVANITDSYVAVGASSFKVTSASKLRTGQTVMIQRDVTEKWIRANGMADLVRDGKHQIWLEIGLPIQQPRTIKSISGDTVTVDVPLTDAIDAKYGQGVVAIYDFPAAASEMGIENLGMTLSPSCAGASITDTDCTGAAVSIPAWITDSWIRNLKLTGFNQFIKTEPGAMRLTIDHVAMYRDKPTNKSAGYPADVSVLGTQILVNRCSSYGSKDSTTFPVVAQNLTAGPNAVRDLYSEQSGNKISPHQRWGHGFLVENSRASLQLANRGTAGTGQGWASNAGVGWNIEGSGIEVLSPPTGTNWCIGCKGSSISGNGTFIEKGNTVTPKSLFQAQLDARKGN